MMKETLQARSTQVSLDGGTAEDEQCIVLASPLEQTIAMGCKDTFKIQTQKVQSDDPSRYCSRLAVVQTAGVLPRLFAKFIEWAIQICC
jgi:hypothetical protein